MIVGKTFTFEAAHFLPNHEKCGRVHGHTYKVTVEVEGPVCNGTNMVIDLHVLSAWVRSITEEFDHQLLNACFSEVPTCENLAHYIYTKMTIDNQYPDLRIYSVTVQEGEGGYAKAKADR